MSVIDILFRVDEICEKFDKHDVNKQRELNAYGDDAFAYLYASVESDIEAALNNSIQPSINYKTEISFLLFFTQKQNSGGRKNEKTTILEDKRLAQPNCGVQASLSDCTYGEYNKVKGLSKEELEICHDLVLALPERIQATPDGTMVTAKQTGGWAGSAPNKNFKFDSSDEQLQDDFTNKVKNQVNLDEYEMWKLKQDQGLDFILEKLETLKNLAHDMNEELDRQVPPIDKIDKGGQGNFKSYKYKCLEQENNCPWK